jgi:signal transduction histidine kinase
MSQSSPDTMLQRSVAVERAPARYEPAPGAIALHVVRRRRWSSIERQLPLLILALLVPTVVTLAVCVHRSVSADLMQAGLERLEANGREIAGIFDVQLRQSLTALQRMAGEPDMVGFAMHPDTADEAAARKVLDPWMRSSRPFVAELWNMDSRRLLQVRSKVAEGTPVPALHTFDWPAPAESGHRPLQLIDGKPVFEMAAEVRTRQGETVGPVVGRLVMRRTFVGGQGAEMLGRLVGTNCKLLLGNEDGTLWTNVDNKVAPPSVDPLDPAQRVFRDHDGVLRFGTGFKLKDTPWVLWVETDGAGALAPADHLLFIMLLAGGGLLLAGGFAAWGISRRITRPLREATEAAEAIAAGDYDRRLLLRRHDEVGRLTQAFNTMAAEVEDARNQQEALVARRTSDLSLALRQLRDAQDDLVRQEKLALMGQLAGSVGHELRNPLGVMTNAIYYLDMVLEQSSPEVRDYLGILRRQVSLSEKIITDLLDFTRHRPPNAGPVDLARVVAEQLERLGPLRVQLDDRIPKGLPTAWADGVQVGQIVFNLLTNAAQAMENQPDGKLSVRAHARDGRIRLEVADTGPGVSADKRERIFEPLFTTRARGIGLGLSVSRRLAEGNGGSLTLAEARGSGATFVLELPIGERQGS